MYGESGGEAVITYPKIETLYNRGDDFRVRRGDYRCPEFALIRGYSWVATEKVDGTNIRVGWDGEKVEVNGRSDNAQLPGDLLKWIGATFTAEKLSEFFKLTPGGPQAVIFGEGYGNGIQKGGRLSPQKKVILFDVNIGGVWMPRQFVEDAASAMGVEAVPVLPQASLLEIVEMVAEGFASQLGERPPAEGVVCYTEPRLLTRGGARLVWKLKTKDFSGERMS